MFRVEHVILSENIATSRFACNIARCKGACCVVGDAGAPVEKGEIPVLEKAFGLVKDRLTPAAKDAVDKHGVVQQGSHDSYEITCVDGGDCVFVEKNDEDVAMCAIQNAHHRGEIHWEKPLSCHLYPVRLKKVAGLEYANFEYVPETCSSGCAQGSKDRIYLSDFLGRALRRRYGTGWYDEFQAACDAVRNGDQP